MQNAAQNALTSFIVKISPTTIDGEAVPTVNARELHAELNLERDFSDWIRRSLKRARMAEDRDYVISYMDVGNSKRGRPAQDYHLTLDAAKHISMMSNTEKGFAAREYFLACERAAKAVEPKPAEIQNPVLRALAIQMAEIDRLEQQQKTLTLTVQSTVSQLATVDQRLANVETRVGAQDAKFFTVLAYARIKGIALTNAAAATIGKAAVRLSKELGIDTGTVRDERYGFVNTYHEDVLAQVAV